MAEKDVVNAGEDKIKISDEVIATIAGIAASGVDDVASMSGGFSDGIAGMLGRKNLSKGIKVEVGEKEVTVDLSIVVRYGSKIHIAAREIQNKVRSAIEEMTGMKVLEVNVSVVGVNIGKEIENREETEISEEETEQA